MRVSNRFAKGPRHLTGSLISPSAPDGYGNCILTSIYDGNGHYRCEIKQADPRIAIAHDLLHGVLTGQIDIMTDHPGDIPWLQIELTDGCLWCATQSRSLGCTDSNCNGLKGAIIRIHADNQNALYVITKYDPAIHAWEAQWPD